VAVLLVAIYSWQDGPDDSHSTEQVEGWIATTLELTLDGLDEIARAIRQTGAGAGPALPK
jgi:hypothetical protein